MKQERSKHTWFSFSSRYRWAVNFKISFTAVWLCKQYFYVIICVWNNILLLFCSLTLVSEPAWRIQYWSVFPEICIRGEGVFCLKWFKLHVSKRRQRSTVTEIFLQRNFLQWRRGVLEGAALTFLPPSTRWLQTSSLHSLNSANFRHRGLFSQPPQLKAPNNQRAEMCSRRAGQS